MRNWIKLDFSDWNLTSGPADVKVQVCSSFQCAPSGQRKLTGPIRLPAFVKAEVSTRRWSQSPQLGKVPQHPPPSRGRVSAHLQFNRGPLGNSELIWQQIRIQFPENWLLLRPIEALKYTPLQAPIINYIVRGAKTGRQGLNFSQLGGIKTYIRTGVADKSWVSTKAT